MGDTTLATHTYTRALASGGGQPVRPIEGDTSGSAQGDFPHRHAAIDAAEDEAKVEGQSYYLRLGTLTRDHRLRHEVPWIRGWARGSPIQMWFLVGVEDCGAGMDGITWKSDAVYKLDLAQVIAIIRTRRPDVSHV